MTDEVSEKFTAKIALIIHYKIHFSKINSLFKFNIQNSLHETHNLKFTFLIQFSNSLIETHFLKLNY